MHISIIKTSVSVKIGSSHKSLDHQGIKLPRRKALGLSNLENLEMQRACDLWLDEHNAGVPKEFSFGNRLQ